MKTLHGKCPRCCPDGGACFSVVYDYDSGKDVKKCNNCNATLPIRKINRKPSAPNETQNVLIERFRAAGWAVTVEMIGRKAFLKFDHPTRHWMLGNAGCGTVGPNGSLKLKLFRMTGADAAIHDMWDFRNYLEK